MNTIPITAAIHDGEFHLLHLEGRRFVSARWFNDRWEHSSGWPVVEVVTQYRGLK